MGRIPGIRWITHIGDPIQIHQRNYISTCTFEADAIRDKGTSLTSQSVDDQRALKGRVQSKMIKNSIFFFIAEM